MKNLKLNKVILALFAVSALNGIAFAETDAEKIVRLELELKEYKEISNKYRADLDISHQTYQQYQIEMDQSYALINEKLKEVTQGSYKVFDEQQEKFENELTEEVTKTDNIKNNLDTIGNKIKSLEKEEKKLKDEKNQLINDFNQKIKNLNEELLKQTEESTHELDQKIKELNTARQNEDVLKKQLIDIIEQHKKNLSASKIRFKQREAGIVEHYKTVGSTLEARLKVITNTKSVTVEQLKKNIEDVVRLTERLKINP
uniref:Uncharacterized protein n=1 Tax=Caedibacter taeniospiralis TaxID=28907 RepID=Q6TFF9_CAETA|nr:hypothetical protein [Caedibacter taeniospiralis]AAR87100.1 hypothetical protein [Caedibacter taeniospiralis]